MQKPWSLYNKQDNLRVDDLTAQEVRIVLLATATSRMQHWYACQEGDVHWQPISAIPEFYEDVRLIKGNPSDQAQTPAAEEPPPPQKKVQRRPLFEEAPPGMKTDPTLQVDLTRTKERRSARRYPRRLDFEIQMEGKVFRCRTTDISMAGLALDQDMPEWVPKNFRAQVSLNRSVVVIGCSRVNARQMKIKESSSWDILRSWIVNW